jgi:hypothetical protein
MNPTSKPVTIYLINDGEQQFLSGQSLSPEDEEISLQFTFNTYSAFQQRTGKFWMDWWFEIVGRVQTAAPIIEIIGQMREQNGGEVDAAALATFLSGRNLSGLEAMSIVSPGDMQAFIWAAAHSLAGPELEVRRRFKFGEVGVLLNFEHFADLLGPIMKGIRDSVPQPKKPAIEETDAPRPTKHTPRNERKPGGVRSGPTDEAVLALAIKR